MLSDQYSISEIFFCTLVIIDDYCKFSLPFMQQNYLRNLKIESLCIQLQKLYITAFSLRLIAVDELIFMGNASQSTLKVFQKLFQNCMQSISISESLNISVNCQVWNGMEYWFNRIQQHFVTALIAFAVIF